MGWIRTIEPHAASIAERRDDRDSAGQVERIIELSSWMMILGTIRLTCAAAEYVKSYLESSRLEPFTLRMLGSFLRENHPVVVLGVAWPLMLGLALRRTRWPELLRAAAVTFLILSIGGMLELMADWEGNSQGWYTMGSFHIARRAAGHMRLPDMMLVVLGGVQLLLELGTAIRAIQLAIRGREALPEASDRQIEARRSRFGRLAIYTSLAYLILMIRLPVWSAYLEVLNHSRPVREFILQNDLSRIKRTSQPASGSAEAALVRDTQFLLSGAMEAWNGQQYVRARELFQRLTAMMEAIPIDSKSAGARFDRAQVLNNLAWLLATCPEPALRDPGAATRFARRAVELGPAVGSYWNTLGVALYRAGDWEEAKNALYRSMELRNEGDSFDWFFLALIHLKLGHRDRAREWYTKAVDWFRRDRSADAELYRFQVEAAQELGLPKPEAPPPPPEMVRDPFNQSDAMFLHRRRPDRFRDPRRPVP